MFDQDIKRFANDDQNGLIYGGVFYDLHTRGGKKAISLRTARKHTREELFFIMDYMDKADHIDTDANAIHEKSYENIIQALSEKELPLTPEQEAAKERIREVLIKRLNQK